MTSNLYDFEEDELHDFDFEPDEEIQFSSPQQNEINQDNIYQRYRTPELSIEETKKMSPAERLQYVQDLKREREYLQSAGFTKSALSGLTLGATEHIPVLKPQEHELLKGPGEFVGATLPIVRIAKAISIPVKYALSGISKAPQTLNSVSKLMTAFGTGASYETGKQIIKGEGFSPEEILKRGTEFATVDLLFQGGGKLFNWVKSLSPKQQAAILEQGIIPEDLPRSQYETAEQVLNELKKGKEKNYRFVGGEPLSPPGTSPTLKGRNITEPQDIGLRPVAFVENKNLGDEVGNLFSENRFYNTTEGGKALKNEIMNLDEEVYRGVGEMYNISRELNKGIEEIHPQLVQKLEMNLESLKKIPEPSDVQKRLIRAQEKILKNVAEFENIKDEAGNVVGKEITGYKPINNQILIDQVQSLRQIIDYDFSHGNTKNVFKPLINDIESAALSAAKHSGNEQAAEALIDAKAGYKAWVEAFDNDYVRPFRDASNQDFSKLFKSSLDFDESNVLRNILNLSGRGRELNTASVREIVEKNLSKFFKDPQNVDSSEFNKALRELESVITTEQSQQIKDKFRDFRTKKSFKAKEAIKNTSIEEEIASKYLGNEPEDIQKLMNSRSGIKQLRKDLSQTESKKKLFDTLSKQKIRSILREGNIEKEFTGDDLYRFLNKEKNYEILSEILGEESTEAMRLEAKDIGKAQIRRDKIGQKIKRAAALKSMLFILSLV